MKTITIFACLSHLYPVTVVLPVNSCIIVILLGHQHSLESASSVQCVLCPCRILFLKENMNCGLVMTACNLQIIKMANSLLWEGQCRFDPSFLPILSFPCDWFLDYLILWLFQVQRLYSIIWARNSGRITKGVSEIWTVMSWVIMLHQPDNDYFVIIHSSDCDCVNWIIAHKKSWIMIGQH